MTENYLQSIQISSSTLDLHKMRRCWCSALREKNEPQRREVNALDVAAKDRKDYQRLEILGLRSSRSFAAN
jgi:hypothetical protein